MAEKVNDKPVTEKHEAYAASLRAIKAVQATAASATAGPGPTHGSASSTSPSAGNTATGGGNGGNAQPPANSGSGGGSGSSGSWKKMFKSSVFLTIGSLATALCAIYIGVWRTSESGVALEKEHNQLEAKKLEIEHMKANVSVMNAAAASGIMPTAGYQAMTISRVLDNPGNTVPSQLNTVAKQKTVVNGDSVTCDSPEEVDRAYESITTQEVNASNQSLRIGKGCASFRVHGNFSQFKGSNYIFSIAEKDVMSNGRQGYFYKCGDISGSHDPESLCLGMINKYANLPVFVSIQNGGSITFE